MLSRYFYRPDIKNKIKPIIQSKFPQLADFPIDVPDVKAAAKGSFQTTKSTLEIRSKSETYSSELLVIEI